jgi:anti-sigma factor RsiW
MATCKAVRELMSAYIDGELPESLATEVRSHLSHCAACAEYRDDLTALGGLLEVPATVRAGDDFTANVLARVREREDESALSRLRRAVWRPMPGWAAAAAIALAVTFGSGLARLTTPSTPPQIADTGAISREFGLDAFEPLSEDSIGGAYVQVAWPQDGEAR